MVEITSVALVAALFFIAYNLRSAATIPQSYYSLVGQPMDPQQFQAEDQLPGEHIEQKTPKKWYKPDPVQYLYDAARSRWQIDQKRQKEREKGIQTSGLYWDDYNSNAVIVSEY